MPRKSDSAPHSSRMVRFRWNGKRRTISLRRFSARDVEMIDDYVQRIVKAKAAGREFDHRVDSWLREISDELHGKIAAHGLIEPRKPVDDQDAVRLGPFLDSYMERRADLKEGTRTFYGHVLRNLKEFFGPDKRLADITEGDADDFRWHLLKVKDGRRNAKPLAQVTVDRRCHLAKTIFKAAVRRRLIAKNPFDDMRTGVRSNPERQVFIPAEVVYKILDACPDAEWRCLIALSRFAGLRVPSEALLLRWGDFLWSENRFLVHSPKTAHHQGKDSRFVPIFAELRPYIDELFESAAEGAEFVLPSFARGISRSPQTWQSFNLRTQFLRIIRRAGVEPWPRLWHALRSSRQTELSHRFPEYIVCKWMGNSERVADKHYLLVRSDDFARAAAEPTGAPPKTCLPAAAGSDSDPSMGDARREKPLVFSDVGEAGNSRELKKVVEMGLEQSGNGQGICGPEGDFTPKTRPEPVSDFVSRLAADVYASGADPYLMRLANLLLTTPPTVAAGANRGDA